MKAPLSKRAKKVFKKNKMAKQNKVVSKEDQEIIKRNNKFIQSIRDVAKEGVELDHAVQLRDRKYKKWTIILEVLPLLEQLAEQSNQIDKAFDMIAQVLEDLPKINTILLELKDTHEQNKLGLKSAQISNLSDEIKKVAENIKR